MVSKKNKIKIFIIVAAILVLAVIYSIVVCNKTQIKTQKDEAMLILDSFYVLFEDYKSRHNGKFDVKLTPGMNAKQFQQILGIKSEYFVSSRIFTDEDVILTKIDSNSGKYEISIKSAGKILLLIDESNNIK